MSKMKCRKILVRRKKESRMKEKDEKEKNGKRRCHSVFAQRSSQCADASPPPIPCPCGQSGPNRPWGQLPIVFDPGG